MEAVRGAHRTAPASRLERLDRVGEGTAEEFGKFCRRALRITAIQQKRIPEFGPALPFGFEQLAQLAARQGLGVRMSICTEIDEREAEAHRYRVTRAFHTKIGFESLFTSRGLEGGILGDELEFLNQAAANDDVAAVETESLGFAAQDLLAHMPIDQAFQLLATGRARALSGPLSMETRNVRDPDIDLAIPAPVQPTIENKDRQAQQQADEYGISEEAQNGHVLSKQSAVFSAGARARLSVAPA